MPDRSSGYEDIADSFIRAHGEALTVMGPAVSHILRY